MTTTQPPTTVAPPRKPAWRRYLPPVLSLVLMGGVFFWFLPQFTSIADVWTVVRDMSTAQIVILVVASIWNIATSQFAFIVIMPGMNLRQPPVNNETTPANSNTV